jgi:hypothetical protein
VWKIGYAAYGVGWGNFNLSNFRYTKGTALYTTTFTPSTTPLTTSVPSGTVSLLTCQDNRFKDNSPTPNTLTPYGDVKVTPFSPFSNSLAYSPSVHGGSGYFDGNGDYLRLTNQANLAQNHTWECWIYLLKHSTSWSSICRYMGDVNNNGKGYGDDFYLASVNVGNQTQWLRLNEWTHLAYSLSGTTLYVYRNGILMGTYSKTPATNPDLTIGGASDSATPYNAYITDIRYVVGTDLYTGSSFTPPTAPLTAVSGTSLLCNFTNGAIIDSTGKNNLETVGNAQVSTTTKKFGNGAMYFDGSGDWFLTPNTSYFDFSSSNVQFTIEAWIYPSMGNVYRGIIGARVNFSGSGWCVYVSSSNKLTMTSLIIGQGFADREMNSTNIALNTWTHIAVVKSASGYTGFVNGVPGTTLLSSNGLDYQPSQPVIIGALGSGGEGPFNGYIDELRITKGKALYTSNFTPSSIANYY